MAENHIRSLIESVQLVFSNMVHTEVEIGEPFVRGHIEREEVVGVVELSGDLTGAVILSSAIPTAKAIVEQLSGESCNANDPMFIDAFGELLNLIAGAAKSKFNSGRVIMSVPSVTIGKQVDPMVANDSVCICLPCSTEVGPFCVDIAVCETVGNTRAAS